MECQLLLLLLMLLLPNPDPANASGTIGRGSSVLDHFLTLASVGIVGREP